MKTKKKTKYVYVNKSNENNIPFYLSKQNGLFDQTITSVLQQTDLNSSNIEDLRKIASLIHHIELNNLDQLLWETYLLSGTGQIKILEQHVSTDNLSIWPIVIKQIIIKKKFENIQNESEITPHICCVFVQDYLRQLRTTANELRSELISIKRRLTICTNELYQTMENLVHVRYINQYKLIIQSKIRKIEYDFHDKFIELEYLQLKPNPYQVNYFHLYDHLYFSFLFLFSN